MNTRVRILAAVFGGALVLRLVVLGMVLPKLNPDVDLDYYRSLACSLASGDGFVATAPNGQRLPNVARTPVYPLFLAGLISAAGDRLPNFLVAQCILGAVTCALTALMASRWLSWDKAVWAGALVAVDPNSVVRCADLRTETFFTLLLIAGTCALAWGGERAWLWLLAGLLWSSAALCRPIAVGLWGVVLIVVLRTATSFRRALFFGLFLAGFVPGIALWAARNAAVTGHWFVSTISTENLLTSWVTSIRAEQRGVNLQTVQAELTDDIWNIEFFQDRTHWQQAVGRAHRLFRETISSAPAVAAKHVAAGWIKLLLGPGARSLENSLREPKTPPKWWPPFYSAALLVVTVLAVLAVVKCRKTVLLPALLALYFVALAGGPVSYSRYRVPITPVLAILAVAGTPSWRKNA